MRGDLNGKEAYHLKNDSSRELRCIQWGNTSPAHPYSKLHLNLPFAVRLNEGWFGFFFPPKLSLSIQK